MKILIDLGHPAHFHYFKNFIKIMSKKNYTFLFVARDKEVLQKLLNENGIEYIDRGKGKKTLLGKLFYILQADYIIWKAAKKFKPDLFLSFASTYAAHCAFLMRKPHITLDDTEHASLEILMYKPFSTLILNPSCYTGKISKKQKLFNSFMELFYLHPKYFTPNFGIVKQYDINEGSNFFILRFVSWNASHDIGQKGLSYESKKKIINILSSYGKVLISSEAELPKEFEKYRIKISPSHLHHFLAYSALYVGEGSTTASECAMLGTPNFYINSLNLGYISELQNKYNLTKQIVSEEELFNEINLFIQSGFDRTQYQIDREKMLKDKIDGTDFLCSLIENYSNR